MNIDCLSIRKEAILCNIDKTVFLWLHQFLGILKPHQALHDEDLVEDDEILFYELFKR